MTVQHEQREFDEAMLEVKQAGPDRLAKVRFEASRDFKQSYDIGVGERPGKPAMVGSYDFIQRVGESRW
jgi:hypothetical protein